MLRPPWLRREVQSGRSALVMSGHQLCIGTMHVVLQTTAQEFDHVPSDGLAAIEDEVAV